jgi:hypothetical protein
MKGLDRKSVAALTDAILDLYGEEVDRLVASWKPTIGNDLALARPSMSTGERRMLDASADELHWATMRRLMKRWGDPIAPDHGDVAIRLSELAQGHLVAIAGAAILEPDRVEHLDAGWPR